MQNLLDLQIRVQHIVKHCFPDRKGVEPGAITSMITASTGGVINMTTELKYQTRFWEHEKLTIMSINTRDIATGEE